LLQTRGGTWLEKWSQQQHDKHKKDTNKDAACCTHTHTHTHALAHTCTHTRAHPLIRLHAHPPSAHTWHTRSLSTRWRTWSATTGKHTHCARTHTHTYPHTFPPPLSCHAGAHDDQRTTRTFRHRARRSQALPQAAIPSATEEGMCPSLATGLLISFYHSTQMAWQAHARGAVRSSNVHHPR
jgi:hypothetical protein